MSFLQDLCYFSNLPGRKILTRGNHEMFRDVKRTAVLNRQFQPELTFLQESYAVYRDYALTAAKDFTFEGPLYLYLRSRSSDGLNRRKNTRRN